MNNLKSWFSHLSNSGKVITSLAALFIGFGAIGAAAQPDLTKTTDTSSVKAAETTSLKVEVKPLSITEPIPFTSSTIEDSSLGLGLTQTKINGVEGILTHTYQVTYTNGIETSRSGPIDTITTQPINEVIAKGTYVAAPICPNGTYVNTVGNTVCSPYASPSAPSGATARCSDGTYSFSQSRRGTCSHHGGVAVWL